MKLYKAQYVTTEMDHNIELDGVADPEGWEAYCEEKWGEYREFFGPSDSPVYRSRSAAQARVDLINRWFGDGAAVLMESEPQWVSVADANRRRRLDRASQRAAKLRAQADRIMREAESAA